MRLLFALALAVALVGAAVAQNRVRTETIRPPAAPAPAPEGDPPPLSGWPPMTQVPAPGGAPQTPPVAAPAPPVAAPKAPAVPPRAVLPPPKIQPDILTDLARVPAPVARMHARILEAARSGDLGKLVTAMQTNETMPIFSFGKEQNPIAYWRANYPDSEGLEVLGILVSILEAGFVHIDRGTPQEMYVWPYFAFTPLKSLTSEQKVELFRIVTGADYQAMTQFGAYTFYRLGIAPDGTWHFFVSGR